MGNFRDSESDELSSQESKSIRDKFMNEGVLNDLSKETLDGMLGIPDKEIHEDYEKPFEESLSWGELGYFFYRKTYKILFGVYPLTKSEKAILRLKYTDVKPIDNNPLD